ncbi:hypothetical protein HCR18_05215 [Wolbachia pipientis]|uniref:hypothetical protein n=1 Tax=Wolbachia pipientis TaxID=955 RepID=UPI0015F7A946|nr:hypothetical protein [Wolbachia pipientis]MBA8758419.1 hypothetical protein [Wolbachia pipientis]MBA8770726.1 hypothetical protein [Wolbachia pipientis]
MKNNKFVIPLLVSGIYAEIPRTTVRTFILEGKLHSKWCHSSLESSLAVISSRTLCFNIRSATFMLTNLVPNQNSCIPDWDDILLVGSNCNVRTVVRGMT